MNFGDLLLIPVANIVGRARNEPANKILGKGFKAAWKALLTAGLFLFLGIQELWNVNSRQLTSNPTKNYLTYEQSSFYSSENTALSAFPCSTYLEGRVARVLPLSLT